MRCSCGKEAVLPLFMGEKRQWGLCEEHLSRWELHPLIYIDGIGTNGIEFLKKRVEQIRYRKPYSDVVISYPTSVEGTGTYTDRALETLKHISDYMKRCDVASILPTKPILFIGSPFALFAQCLLIDRDRAEQYAVHFLRRPAVWVMVSHDGSYPEKVKEVVKKAHQTQPFTYTRFMETGKSEKSFWLPLKVAYQLWVDFSTYRKRNSKQGVKEWKQPEE